MGSEGGDLRFPSSNPLKRTTTIQHGKAVVFCFTNSFPLPAPAKILAEVTGDEITLRLHLRSKTD